MSSEDEAVRITPENAQSILDDLRLCADRKFIEPIFGDHVWLKSCNDGKGVTDCCLVDDPCEYHKRLTHEAVRKEH